MKATAFPKVSPVRADPCFYEIWGSFSDKGYVSRELAAWATTRQVTILRPHRQGEPTNGPRLGPSRQRIEPIFWTCKEILTLERHGACTLAGLRERGLERFCSLAAAITLNHQIGASSRALVNYCA